MSVGYELFWHFCFGLSPFLPFRYFIEVIRTETVMTKTTDTDPAIIMPTVDKEILIFSVGDNVRAYLFTKKTRMTKH